MPSAAVVRPAWVVVLLVVEAPPTRETEVSHQEELRSGREGNREAATCT